MKRKANFVGFKQNKRNRRTKPRSTKPVVTFGFNLPKINKDGSLYLKHSKQSNETMSFEKSKIKQKVPSNHTFFSKIFNVRKKWYNRSMKELPFVYFSRTVGHTQYLTDDLVVEKIFLGHKDSLKDVTKYLFNKTRIGRNIFTRFKEISSITNITPREVRNSLIEEIKLRAKKAKALEQPSFKRAGPPASYLVSKIQNRETFSMLEELITHCYAVLNAQRLQQLKQRRDTQGTYSRYAESKLLTPHSILYSLITITADYGSVESGIKSLLAYIETHDLGGMLKRSIQTRIHQYGFTYENGADRKVFHFHYSLDEFLKDIQHDPGRIQSCLDQLKSCD